MKLTDLIPSGLPPAITSRIYDGRNVVVHNDDADIRPALWPVPSDVSDGFHKRRRTTNRRT